VVHAATAEDKAFVREAAEIAQGLDWATNPWGAMTAALKANSGRTGKSLFLPLRQALTGLDSGPEMAALMPLIGREESVARLRAAAA
jgi:glutamyl-tRNA synthetase